MFKIITTTLAATSLLALGATTAAANDMGDQPPSPRQVAPQSAGGFGATTMWAYVLADGSHAEGSGGSAVANSNKLSTGQYEVIFKRGVHNNCMFLGFSSAQSLGTAHGFVDVVRRDFNTKGVYVQTRDTAGNLTDMAFAVLLSCSK